MREMSEVDRNPRQFSVRDLLKLTLIVSVILMIGILSRGSQYFGAFSMPWTAVSLLPIVVVWSLYRWRVCTPGALAVISVICYGVALGMPALGWGEEIMFGWQAWLDSFMGVDFFRDRHIDGGWLFGTITIEWEFPIACAIGAAANLAYLVAVSFSWSAQHKPRSVKHSHLTASAATIMAVVVLPPMCLTGDLATLYPGYGLWAASMLALALATFQWGQPPRNAPISK